MALLEEQNPWPVASIKPLCMCMCGILIAFSDTHLYYVCFQPYGPDGHAYALSGYMQDRDCDIDTYTYVCMHNKVLQLPVVVKARCAQTVKASRAAGRDVYSLF
jgi:hypothetical protein